MNGWFIGGDSNFHSMGDGYGSVSGTEAELQMYRGPKLPPPNGKAAYEYCLRLIARSERHVKFKNRGARNSQFHIRGMLVQLVSRSQTNKFVKSFLYLY